MDDATQRARQKLGEELEAVLLAKGAKVARGVSWTAIPSLMIELTDGTRHHLRLINMAGREHDRIPGDEAASA